jgi:hypothetical protein
MAALGLLAVEMVGQEEPGESEATEPQAGSAELEVGIILHGQVITEELGQGGERALVA